MQSKTKRTLGKSAKFSLRKSAATICGVMLLALFVFKRVSPLTVLNSSADGSIILYADTLNWNGWGDWSYDTAYSSESTFVESGNSSLKITHDDGWGALYMHANQSISLDEIDRLTLHLNGGTDGDQFIFVRLADSEGNWVDGAQISLESNRWQEVNIDLSQITGLDMIGGVIVQNGTSEPSAPYYLDGMTLYKEGGAIVPTPTTAGPTATPIIGFQSPDYNLTVDTYSLQHDISPYIYGVNLADYQMGDELNLPVNRYGGNSTSRYNWKNSSTNLGHDWYFMGQARGNDTSSLPHGSVTDLFVEQNRATGTDTLLTIPMMGYVSKSREVTCGFSVEKYGAQQKTENWHPDCGNGRKADPGSGDDRITGNDPLDTSIPVDEEFVQEWIQHLNGKYGHAANGGVKFYSLDNEPMLWFYNHQDVHPEPTSYDEIRDKTFQYAPAIKAIDPTAQTIGPAVWGWHAYFSSALDQDSLKAGNGYADRAAHGNAPFLEWYLKEMSTYEDENDLRILDYLDLHYYPQSDGVTLSPVGDSDTMQRRLDSTRSLWDRGYTDKSWIGQPVYLVPRMHDMVEENYPGTKLSISEYNFGGLEHINGAVTQADVLGIYGRENLHMAMLWGWLDIDASEPWAHAFRMYRNYDGQKSTFGDQSLNASTSNEWDMSIFAARRSHDDAVTIIVINKTFEAATADIALQGLASGDAAEVYQYSDADLNNVRYLGTQSVGNNHLLRELPGQSITLFVIKNTTFEQLPTPTPAPNATATPLSEAGDEIPDTPPVPTATPGHNDNPRDPDHEWDMDETKTVNVELDWLSVRVPAYTFNEDVVFELKYHEGFSDPGQSVQELGSASKDVAFGFSMGAYSKATNGEVVLKPGQKVDVTIDVSGQVAQSMAQGKMGLFEYDIYTREYTNIPTSVRGSQVQSISFRADAFSTWVIRPEQNEVFLPLMTK